MPYIYSYAENGLLIAAEESLRDDGKFAECIKTVYDFLNRIVCRDFMLSYECAIVMYEEDAQGNLYYPGQFPSIAKEYDLYGALSVIMVKKVMSMFLHKDVKITINLNVQDIYDEDMIEMIFHYLKLADYPENFVFELVESEEVTDYQYIEQFAESIHNHGTKIAIDDFGSGFSNLLHIIKINADIIKIDGEIIKVICQDENCREFVTMINGWCQNTEKEVIGEFVENENIQQIMEKIGIAHSQGYYYAKPVRWEDIAGEITCVRDISEKRWALEHLTLQHIRPGCRCRYILSLHRKAAFIRNADALWT